MSRKPGTSKKHAGSKKHTGAKKHGAGAKHNPTYSHLQHEINRLQRQVGRLQHPAVHHKASQPPKPRGAPLTVTGVHCCTAEALACSLRMAGWPVGEEDVLSLYFLTTDDPQDGCSIQAALDAAFRSGLAGVAPRGCWRRYGLCKQPGDIVGLLMPDGQRHTVTYTRSGLFSWNEYVPRDKWEHGGIVEEVWSVRWPR